MDGEHAQILKNAEMQNKKKSNVVVKQSKVPQWKKQSDELRAVAKNKDGTMVIPSSQADSLTHCQFCNRKYNEQAYNKHLDFCKKKAMTNNMGGGGGGKTTSKTSTTNSKPNLNLKFKK